MPAPETQFGQAGIQIPAFTPVPLHLNPPIQLPGTGELWAQAGKNLMAGAHQVFSDLMQSPLNPEVKAQIQLGAKAAHVASGAIDESQNMLGGKMLWGIDANGRPYMRAPVETGTAWGPYFQPKIPTDKNAPPAPPAPSHDPHTRSTTPTPTPKEEPKSSKETPYGGMEEKREGAPATPTDPNKPPESSGYSSTAATPGNLFASTSRTQPPSPDNFQGPTQGQTTAAVQEALSRNRFASTGQGVPAGYQAPQPSGPQGAPEGTFLNPATGSYEPMQTQPPQGPQPHVAQAVAESQRHQDLTNWQNTTQTEPMTADDAMKYIRRKTTLAQDATYLPHGGPNQEPAYAFHMKGGGVNTIPVSQMVKDGAGPTVAAQNTSAVLSQSDRLKQQEQQPQGGQVWNPQQPAPLQPQQPSDQGGARGAPAAPGTAYNPAPYQQAVTQAVANQQNLTADTERAGQPATASTAGDKDPAHALVRGVTDEEKTAIGDTSKIEADVASKNIPVDTSKGNPNVGTLPNGWVLYRDDVGGNGRLYTTLPGTSNYRQQRYYLGSDGFREYNLPDTVINQNLEAEFGGGSGGMAGKPCPNCVGGKFPVLDYNAIENMSPDRKAQWLSLAAEYHRTDKTPTNSVMEDRLNGLMDQSRRVQRLDDGVETAKEAKVSALKGYSEPARELSAEARLKEENIPTGVDWWNPTTWPGGARRGFWWLVHGLGSQFTPINELAEDFKKETKGLRDAVTQTPGRQEALMGPKEGKTTDIRVPTPWGTGEISTTGQEAGETGIRDVDRLLESGDQAEAQKGLRDYQARINQKFEESYADAVRNGFRLSPAQVKHHYLITHQQTPQDGENQFRDKNSGNLKYAHSGEYPFPSVAKPPPGPSPTPSQTPDLTGKDLNEFKKNNKSGTPFYWKGELYYTQ